MHPALSRRVGKLMMTDPIRALDLEGHLSFVHEVSGAESFDALPRWVREIVLAGEEQFAEVQAQQTSVIEPRAADDVAPQRPP